MKLGILDRIALLSVLPTEGNFVTMAIVKDLHEKVMIHKKEREAIGFTLTESGRGHWNTEKAKEVEYEFDEAEHEVVRKALEKMDQREQLGQDHLGIYKLFMKG